MDHRKVRTISLLPLGKME